MYSPAEIFHGLIDPQTIVPTLLGAKTVVFDFQSSQDSHAAFGQRIAPDPVLSQVLGQNETPRTGGLSKGFEWR